ncbi:TetR family transcriptional regulator [Ponticaulis profundi]|uniref:TetR family transcriptional regulator n=1 Tax=Ponticaulis profundi TaxID=2665222 RepID=A0ABW1SFZ6_9PROT
MKSQAETEVESSQMDARAQLLEAASRIMRERDTLDFSLSDISEKANLNSALVKYYFGNKRGLLDALLERDVGPEVDQLKDLVRLPISPTRRLQIHIEALINLYFRLPYLNRLLMKLIREADDERAQEISNRFVKPITEAYAIIIAEGRARGEFKHIDPELFYFNIIGACDPFFSAGAVLKYCYGIEKTDDELRRRYIAQTSETLLNGILLKG